MRGKEGEAEKERHGSGPYQVHEEIDVPAQTDGPVWSVSELRSASGYTFRACERLSVRAASQAEAATRTWFLGASPSLSNVHVYSVFSHMSPVHHSTAPLCFVRLVSRSLHAASVTTYEQPT